LRTAHGTCLVERLKEPYEDAPLRDVLDRLEALRVLESADTWERIRVMRNALAHDYPESADEKAAALNLAIEMAGQMEAVLLRIRDLSPCLRGSNTPSTSCFSIQVSGASTTHGM